MPPADPLNELLSHFRELEERRQGPITPTVPPPNRVVVFADMLGFSALMESYPVDIRMLTMHDRPLSATLESILSQPTNPLTEAFSRVHFALKWAIDFVSIR